MSTVTKSTHEVSKEESRTRWVAWYTNAVTAVGLGITLYALVHVAIAWPSLLLFASAAAIAELTSVELFANSRIRISVSSMIAIATILVFGPLAGVLTHLISGLMTAITTTLLQHQTPKEQHRVPWWRRSAFNMGMWVIAAALAGWIYVQTGGTPGEVIRWGNVLPLVLAVTIDALVNIALLIGVIGLQTGRRATQIWRQDFQWGLPIAILGGIIGGAGLALGYEGLGLIGLAVFMLPVLATGYAFHLYVHNTRGYVNQLEQMNQSLAAVNQLGHLMAETFELTQIYDQICQMVRTLLPDSDSLFIEQYDSKQKSLKVVYGYHQGQQVAVNHFAPIVLEGQELDVQRHALLMRQPDSLGPVKNAARSGDGRAAIVCTPMMAHGEVVGILQVQSAGAYRFTKMDQEVLVLLANTAAIFIQQVMLFADLQQSNEQVQQELWERKQAEVVVRRQLLMMENSIDGIILLDANRTYVYVNDAYAALYGYPHPQALIGKPWRDQYAQATQAYLQQVVYPALLTAGKWRGELVGVRMDGSSFPQELSMVHLGHDEFTCIVRDITERKNTEEALNRSQKLESLGLLAGGIAHDFNNLLAGILGQTSLAKVKLPVDSPAYSHLDKAIATSTRAADLTRQLLIYAGKDNVQVKPFQVNDLLNENRGLFEAIVPKHVQLTFALRDDLPLIEGDIGQIQQVLMNLIINATEAIGARHGQVNVQSSRAVITAQTNLNAAGISSGVLTPGVYVAVSVKDNGAGMNKNMLDRIFDPFFSTKGSGRGLGLSATLGIIRQHKGSLCVTSQPGHGSTFQVLLPAALTIDGHPDVELATDELLAPIAGMVLVIDDELIVRDVLGEALRMIGLQVIMAENGQQGLEAFRTHRRNISVVVLDMEMPVMNGADTLRELMRIDPKLGVILTSAYTDYTLLEYSTNKPSVVFLQKPYPIDLFIKTVKEQIRRLATRQ
jgi:PAS domain S-box-containing protein